MRHEFKALCVWLALAVLVGGTFSISPASSQESYRLGPNDVVRIQVYGEDDLTVENKVDGDGNMNLPLLGVLHVGGKTIPELQNDLTARLGRGYLQAPKVTAHVIKHRNIYVTGQVKAPGGYPYEEGLTVHKAISLAGGWTEKADTNSVKVTRIGSGVVEPVTATPDTAVIPDDIIVVEADNHKFYASGEVKNPSSYPYKDGLTVHKAIAMAGGLTDKAERTKFQVLRQVEGHEQTVPVELDSLLRPDDIIVVAEAQRVYVSGEVKTPGRYVFEKGMTVHKAISLAGGWTEKADRGTIKLTRVKDGVAQPIDTDLNVPLLADDFIVVPQIRKVYVNGEVKRAGEYPYERGLTVHKIITMAGGFTDKAAEGSTKILRKVNGEDQSLKANLETIVLPEDILVVPRSFF